MGYDMQWRNEETSRTYFRLNGPGMRWARKHLCRFGMMQEGEKPAAPQDWTNDIQVDAWRSHTPENAVLCQWKFCSNDGWIVTPDEINNALAVWDAAGQPKPDESADLFVSFCEWMRRAAREGGGFEVR